MSTGADDTVLVTGAFGFVGSATIKRLAADGRHVVATSRDSRANRKAARALPEGVEVRWADLTEPGEAQRVVFETAPAAIVHFAGVTPPAIYRIADAARKINVHATAALVRAAESSPRRPRFVQASSAAVYGVRNPHRCNGLLGADTPTRPFDVYGAQKLDAERHVRSSSLEWVIIRLGGVLPLDPANNPISRDHVYFHSALPTDGRLHTIDVRDAATAFAAATSADVAGDILLVAGDESHKLRLSELEPAVTAALGFPTGLPVGRPGNPDRDDGWFPIDWMDTTRAQEALSFQHHSLPDMLAELRESIGWKRFPMRFLVAAATPLLNLFAAYRDDPQGLYADPWEAFRARFGDPYADRVEL